MWENERPRVVSLFGQLFAVALQGGGLKRRRGGSGPFSWNRAIVWDVVGDFEPHTSINRKIKNKICGADDSEGLGSAVTGSADAYIFRPPVPSRDPMELKLPHPDAVWDFAR